MGCPCDGRRGVAGEAVGREEGGGAETGALGIGAEDTRPVGGAGGVTIPIEGAIPVAGESSVAAGGLGIAKVSVASETGAGVDRTAGDSANTSVMGEVATVAPTGVLTGAVRIGGGGAGGTRGAGGGVMDERCVSGVIATMIETSFEVEQSGEF